MISAAGVDPLDCAAKQVSVESEREFRQRGGVEDDKSVRLADDRARPGRVHGLSQNFVVGGEGLCSAPGGLAKFWVVRFERGNEQVTDAVAQEVERVVAGIVMRTKSLPRAVDDGLFAPDIQQGTHERNLHIEHGKNGAIGHALETVQPRAAQEVHEHGLHLIVRGVTDRHGLR